MNSTVRKIDPNAHVECPHCKRFFDEMHIPNCAKRIVKCSKCAAGPMTAYELATVHLSKECAKRPAACPHCKGHVARTDVQHHMKVCAMRSETCSHCGKSMLRKELPAHLKEHGAVEGAAAAFTAAEAAAEPVKAEPCPMCGVEVLPDALTHHKVSECPKREIVCAVCFSIVVADAVEEHNSTCEPPRVRGVMGLEVNTSLAVQVVKEGSSAQKANVMPGDIIVSVKGRQTRARPEFIAAMKEVFAGDEVPVEIKTKDGGSRVVRLIADVPSDLKKRAILNMSGEASSTVDVERL
eukprot:PhM_4_TR15203/c0_g1_i2/m.52382